MAEEKLLIDSDTYLKSGAHIGTKNKSGDMKKYVFKIRPDNLRVMDIQTIDNRIRLAAKLIANYDLDKVAVVGRRLYAKTPIIKFAESIGGKAFTGRFVPGTFTNPQAKEFFEPKIIVVTETDVDMQAVKEAAKIKVPVIAFCSTNNTTTNVDLVIPFNNKGRRSLALGYWLLTRQTLKEKGVIKDDDDFKLTIDDFEYQIVEEERKAEERRKAIQKAERRKKRKKKK
ncbi:MAG: 30S ribosomal protein S2 [Candidatus Diapherotrites archaeon]|nr:30S ribosomal protein S2 [Candidatus Diapherotrites archaeon]